MIEKVPPIEVEIRGVESKRLYTVKEVGGLLSRSESWLYQEVYNGHLRTADVGTSRARLIPGREIVRYIHDRILKLKQ